MPRDDRRRVGSGGQRRRGLQGRGPTPPKEQRTGHPAARRAAAAARRASGAPGGRTDAGGARGGPRRREAPGEGGDVVVGRNPVVEALRAQVPAGGLLVAGGVDLDDRVAEAVRLATRAGVPVSEVSRGELDGRARARGVVHQGVALLVQPYAYADPADVLARAADAGTVPLVVVCDGVTDPHNLGAVVRSAAAFGADGVVVRERRSAGVTAATWRASAGAVARLPVARATNVTRTLRSFSDAGLVALALDADGDVDLDDLDAATDPLAVVVGSEGRGVSRLVGETCDLRVRVPTSSLVESLNASVATSVVLAEVARRRRAAARAG